MVKKKCRFHTILINSQNQVFKEDLLKLKKKKFKRRYFFTKIKGFRIYAVYKKISSFPTGNTSDTSKTRNIQARNTSNTIIVRKYSTLYVSTERTFLHNNSQNMFSSTYRIA